MTSYTSIVDLDPETFTDLGTGNLLISPAYQAPMVLVIADTNKPADNTAGLLFGGSSNAQRPLSLALGAKHCWARGNGKIAVAVL